MPNIESGTPELHDAGEQSILTPILKAIEAAQYMLSIAQAGQGEYAGGYEWSETGRSERRLTLLHLARSLVLTYQRCLEKFSNEKDKLDTALVDQMSIQLTKFKDEIELLSQRLYEKSEEFV